MKKLLQFWPYTILGIILTAYTLSVWPISNNLIFALTTSFLVLHFFIALSFLGNSWALISTFLLAFSKTIINIPENEFLLLSAFSIIITIEFFLFYLRKPSNFHLGVSGILIGSTMAIAREFWIILPLALFLIIVLALAKLGREWDDIDLTMRSHKIKILLRQLFQKIFFLTLATVATVYILFLSPYFGSTENVSKFLLVNWLLNNPALNPLGSYILILENNFRLDGINWLRTLVTRENLPLILFLFFGILMYILNLFKLFIKSIINKNFLVNYLGIYEREFFYTLLILVLGICSVIGANNGLIILTIIPYLMFLATSAIKNWFTVFDSNLTRNVLVKILIFKNNFVSLSLKTAALATILIWHFLASII